MPEPLQPSAADDPGHIKGSSTATVTVVEYGDFECPNCVQAFPALRQLVSAHEDRLRFVFRHFPLQDVHPHAIAAAEAAESAGAQGKFWEFHDLLFTRSGSLSVSLTLALAEQLGLDMDRFNRETTNRVYRPRVVAQLQGSREMGIRGTPGLLLNGQLVDASFGFERLRYAVRSALVLNAAD